MITLPALFASIPEVFRAAFDPRAPWGLLDALDHVLGGATVIEDGARVHPSAVIDGPVYIAAGAQVRPHAFLRGGVWLGAGAVVGASTEIKRGILLPRAQAPHLNYVGDSILGEDVNLGAGCILSNHRHDRAVVQTGGLATGRRKLGAILGDAVQLGCNCVLHPGVIVGRETQTYPGVQLRPGIYPERRVIKLRQELDVVPRT